MSNDNKTWLEEFEEKFRADGDATLTNDDTQARDKVRSAVSEDHINAAEEYERNAKNHGYDLYDEINEHIDLRERRLNTGRRNDRGNSGSHNGSWYPDNRHDSGIGSGDDLAGGDFDGRRQGSLYDDGQTHVYDGYERSGAAYDRRLRGLYKGGHSSGQTYDQGYDQRYDQGYDQRYDQGYDQGGYGYGVQHNDPYRDHERERMQRARNLAREARYKEIEDQREELRRLREESDPYGRSDRREAKRYKKDRRRDNRAGNKKPKKKGRLRKTRRAITILLLLFGIFCLYFLYLTTNFDKVDTANKDLGIDPGVEDQLSGYRNIAVLGSDARSNEGLDGSRTDAIIILSIKKSNGDINMISIMRDSYLKLENANHDLVLDKITHAHHWGGGPGTVAALNRSLDLNIKEFIIFNWQAVADTVDALGGVTVDIKKNEIRDLNKWGPETGRNVGRKYTKITSTGQQEIDGVQATTYCRIRKTSGGDPGRGSRYKKIMAAVMKKGITHPWKLQTLANDVFPNIRTNMSSPGMLWAVLRAPGYDILKSYGWPKKYYGGILGNGLWYAVPRTLDWNVKWLHKKAFGQSGYEPSETCREISNEIMYQTGVQ